MYQFGLPGFLTASASNMLVKANRPVLVHSICRNYAASYDEKYVSLTFWRRNYFFNFSTTCV